MVFAIICTRRTRASTKRGSDGGKKENRAGQGRCVQELGVASAKIRVGLKEESLILMCQARA